MDAKQMRANLICYLKECGWKAETAHYSCNIHSSLFLKTLALSGIVQLPVQLPLHPGLSNYKQKPQNEASREYFERELTLLKECLIALSYSISSDGWSCSSYLVTLRMRVKSLGWQESRSQIHGAPFTSTVLLTFDLTYVRERTLNFLKPLLLVAEWDS